MESLSRSEKRRANWRKYNVSPKGRERTIRYSHSAKGKARSARYQATPHRKMAIYLNRAENPEQRLQHRLYMQEYRRRTPRKPNGHYSNTLGLPESVSR